MRLLNNTTGWVPRQRIVDVLAADGVSERTTDRALSAMYADGLIERQGGTHGTSYRPNIIQPRGEVA